MIGCRPLSRVELRKVVAAAGGAHAARNKALIIFGATTGLRISELLSITVGQVVSNGVLRRSCSVRRMYMKGKVSSRSVRIAAAAAPYLLDLIHALEDQMIVDDDTFLFQSRASGNRAISRVQAFRILRDLFARLGLDLPSSGTHTLRKTYAAEMFDALDKNVFALMHALGHRSPASTVAYLSFDETTTDHATDTAWTKL